MTVVIGTAGHIDHGKTTLLRALTGIDADRLPEERARGMTIDVGYAHLALADGTELDFVDVPGHDRLVGNMLVGAGEIDAALVVIAADDGPRPQTLEHLELLDAIGIEDGVVAVTKIDLVGVDRLEEVAAEAESLVAWTSLRGSRVVRVSATTGDGVDALRDALGEVRERVHARQIQEAGEVDRGSRLAIDRVFSIRGRGTVVTGSLRGAPLERGAILRVVPATPDRTVRVREIQVHGRAVDRASRGRVALNVAGDGIDGLERGMVLTSDAGVVATDRLLVALRPAASVAGGRSDTGGARGIPPDRTRIALHLRTVRMSGVIGRSGRDGVTFDSGEESAILRLDRPIAVAPDDRFVLRRPSPVETLAGGRILDPQPPRGIARRRAGPERLAALAAARPGSGAWRTARLELHGVLGSSPPALAPDVAGAVDDALAGAVDGEAGSRTADLLRIGVKALRRLVSLAGASRDAEDELARRIVEGRLEELVAIGRLARSGDHVTPPGVAASGPSPALVDAMDRLVAGLSAVAPPPLGIAARDAGCPPEGIRQLEAANRIVRLDDDLAWAFPTYRDLAARAVAMAAREPLTPAAFRDATGTSRKYVMAILEDLDRRAILRRTPAGHIPGPRAPRAMDADPDAGRAVADSVRSAGVGTR